MEWTETQDRERKACLSRSIAYCRELAGKYPDLAGKMAGEIKKLEQLVRADIRKTCH